MFGSKQEAVEQKYTGLPKILGARVRDKVTGFEGIATCYHIFLTGCNRVSVQPPVDKDFKLPDACSFDETGLEILEPAKFHKDKSERGGPPVREKRRNIF